MDRGIVVRRRDAFPARPPQVVHRPAAGVVPDVLRSPADLARLAEVRHAHDVSELVGDDPLEPVVGDALADADVDLRAVQRGGAVAHLHVRAGRRRVPEGAAEEAGRAALAVVDHRGAVGPRPGVEEKMLDRVRQLANKHGRKISLVGWSLGGIYARQLAKVAPDEVRSVITLGSPFSGDPRHTNAWRLYERKSGHKVDDRESHLGGPLALPPPVPTTAIFSRSDGICAWQNCVERESAIAENIEVHASHCGLGHHPAAVFAVSDRLAQPEGRWKRFDRSGARALLFPDPKRAFR
jgi:dienelactone hydrolase